MPSSGTHNRPPGQRMRSFQCDDELWAKVLQLAEERGVPAAVVIRAALEAFTESQS